MIIQITGTYGSGKTSVVRAALPSIASGERVLVEGRRAALGHVVGDVFLLGDYDEGRACGGADTVQPLDLAFSTALAQHALGRHVVMEGIFLMSMKRAPRLHRESGDGLQVLQLTTSLEESIAGINARRAARGEERPVSVKKATDHYRTSQSFCSGMRFLGVPVHKVTRETAPGKLRELLGL